MSQERKRIARCGISRATIKETGESMKTGWFRLPIYILSAWSVHHDERIWAEAQIPA
jgi:hypothetical protein